MSYMAAPTQSTAAHRRQLLTFSTEWVDSDVVCITVAGEVDACNASQLRDYVLPRAATCRTLVLDLHEVRFFCSAGFSILRTINARCDRANVRWTLHCSPSVSRILDICESEGFPVNRLTSGDRSPATAVTKAQ